MRSILAIFAGYLSMTVIVLAGQVTVHAFFPKFIPASPQSMTAGYIAYNLAVSLFAAIFGGYMAGTVARKSPMQHALALAAISFTLGVLYAKSSWGVSPHLYLIALLAITVAGVLLGGYLQQWLQREIAAAQM